MEAQLAQLTQLVHSLHEKLDGVIEENKHLRSLFENTIRAPPPKKKQPRAERQQCCGITAKGTILCEYYDSKNRNQAKALVGTKLYCTRDELPNTSKEEFYLQDLETLQVLDLERKKVGYITKVFNKLEENLKSF